MVSQNTQSPRKNRENEEIGESSAAVETETIQSGIVQETQGLNEQCKFFSIFTFFRKFIFCDLFSMQILRMILDVLLEKIVPIKKNVTL